MPSTHLRAPFSPNEAARVAKLRSYEILDTPEEGSFDDITRIAALICGTPMAVISLVDIERQWFKSEFGLGVRETPADHSICAHAILQSDTFVISDTQLDSRTRSNPLVTGDPNLRFYAGATIFTPDGFALGTVCVLDVVPRELTEAQLLALKALARQSMAQIELRKALARSQRAHDFRDQLIAIVGHDLKTPLRSAAYSIERTRGGLDEAKEKRLETASAALTQIDRELNKLLVLATSHETSGGPRLTSFPVADVLDPLAAMWTVAAARKSLTLRYVKSSAMVESHHELLSTIIGNLLSNAVKYTERGSILLGCRRHENTLQIDVIDSGVGISAELSESIFDAFRQADAASEGLGLGLWIVSRSAAMLGHEVTVASSPGHGTRFRVTVRRLDRLP